MSKEWEILKDDLVTHIIRCIHIFTKYYVKGKVQNIRLIGEEGYLHIETTINDHINIIDVDDFQHGKKNREEQRDCYFEEAIWGEFGCQNNWIELSLDLCEELGRRLKVQVKYIDLKDYEEEQGHSASTDRKNNRILQPYAMHFFRQSELEDNDIKKWGRDIFNLINELSILPEKYEIKYIKKMSGEIERYTPNLKKIIECLNQSKETLTIQMKLDEVNLNKESLNQMQDLIKQVTQSRGNKIYEYMIVFYSSLKNKDSVGYYFKIYKNKKYTTILAKDKTDELTVDFSDDFEYWNLEEMNNIDLLFKILIKWFRPDYAYVENKAIYRKIGFNHAYFQEGRPSILNWINYFSPNIIGKIGLDKINEFCKSNKEAEFNNGILKIRKSALDAESQEDLEFLYNAEKMLGLK